MPTAKGERVVAALEAGKGLLVLLVGFRFLAFVDEDTQTLAEEVVSPRRATLRGPFAAVAPMIVVSCAIAPMRSRARCSTYG